METKQLTITIGEPLTKKQECDLITALKLGKGYFADEFTESDSDQMITNIVNDFPILMGTQIEEDLKYKSAKCLQLEQEIIETIEEHKARVEELEKEIERKGTEEISMQRVTEELKSNIEKTRIELEGARENIKTLSEDYTKMTEAYRNKCELLDIAVASIGRLTVKI